MEQKTESVIAKIIGDEQKAAEVLEVIRSDEESRKEALRQKRLAGIQAARDNKVPLGRPRKPLPERFGEVYQAVAGHSLTFAQGAKELQMYPRDFLRKCRQYEEENGLTSHLAADGD